MKLKDLKFMNISPVFEPQKTQSLLNRVNSFLQVAETVDLPVNFESPDENSRHIELNIYLPEMNGIEDFCPPFDDFSSPLTTSSSSSSSSNESDEEDRGEMNEVTLKISPTQKWAKIEEIPPRLGKIQDDT